MNQTVNGLVLRAVNYSENDRILTVLAQGLGRISVSSKGSRNLKNRLASISQPFCYASMERYRGRELYILDGGECINTFFRLQEDLERLALAGYFVQLLDCLTDEYQDWDDALRLALNSLYVLTETEKPVLQVKAVFELRLMALCGYMPDLSGCHLCGKKEGPMLFGLRQGALVCPNCSDGSYEPVAPGVLTAMRYAMLGPAGKIFSFELPEKSLRELEALSQRFTLLHLDRSFKGLEFFNSVRT